MILIDQLRKRYLRTNPDQRTNPDENVHEYLFQLVYLPCLIHAHAYILYSLPVFIYLHYWTELPERQNGLSVCLSYLNSSLNFRSWISRLICDWTGRLIKILVTRFFVFFTFISTFDHNSNYHCDYNDNKYFFELQKSIIECHIIAYAPGILEFITSIWYSISRNSDCSCIIPWASGNAWGTL